MAYQLVEEVLHHAPSKLDPAAKLALVVIAEDARIEDDRRSRLSPEELARRINVQPSSLGKVLSRLQSAGLEVRVQIGTVREGAKRRAGSPVFAVTGRASTYRLPPLLPPAGCTCTPCKAHAKVGPEVDEEVGRRSDVQKTAGQEVGPGSDLRSKVGPASDAVGPASDAVGPASDAVGPASGAVGPASDPFRTVIPSAVVEPGPAHTTSPATAAQVPSGWPAEVRRLAVAAWTRPLRCPSCCDQTPGTRGPACYDCAQLGRDHRARLTEFNRALARARRACTECNPGGVLLGADRQLLDIGCDHPTVAVDVWLGHDPSAPPNPPPIEAPHSARHCPPAPTSDDHPPPRWRPSPYPRTPPAERATA